MPLRYLEVMSRILTKLSLQMWCNFVREHVLWNLAHLMDGDAVGIGPWSMMSPRTKTFGRVIEFSKPIRFFFSRSKARKDSAEFLLACKTIGVLERETVRG